MKRILLFFILSGFVIIGKAQSTTDDANSRGFLERITKIEKKNDRFNLYLNTAAMFNLNFQNEFQSAAFKLNNLRLEAKGNLNDLIFYRYRQRLNRSNSPSYGTPDNLPRSIDYAALGFRVTKDFSIFAGKQCAAYGGFEFDLNPIEIYEYSDMIEYMNNFLTGIDFSYSFNKQQELRLQVLDSRNGSLADMYGKLPANIEASKASFVYTLNWNGAFGDNNELMTRWSASIMNEAKCKNLYYYALGTAVNFDQFNGFFDAMWSREELDREGILTEYLGYKNDSYSFKNVDYLSLVLKLNYKVSPMFNLFAKGMYETSSLYKNMLSVDGKITFDKGKYRTSWGYVGGVEYYPLKGDNLHLFLTYVGRNYQYTKKAESFGLGNSCSNRVSLGFIYQLKMY